VVDGVFVTESDGGCPDFHALPAPTKDDLRQIELEVFVKTLALLEKLGKQSPYLDEAANDEEAFLGACASASVQQLNLFGDEAGKRVKQLGHNNATSSKDLQPNQLASGRSFHGFDLHAGRRIGADDRSGLERLLSYMLRPPFSHDRLEKTAAGQVRVRLKSAWRNGVTHVQLNPLDFIARLAALVPPPRSHQLRFHGQFAPNAKLRSMIVPQPDAGADSSCKSPHQLELFDKSSRPPPAPAGKPKKAKSASNNRPSYWIPWSLGCPDAPYHEHRSAALSQMRQHDAHHNLGYRSTGHPCHPRVEGLLRCQEQAKPVSRSSILASTDEPTLALCRWRYNQTRPGHSLTMATV
jgi:hypothetical protein